MTRLVFLGTPASAVPTLERLARRHDVGLAITQPDRPKGRSAKPVAPPVKVAASKLGVDLAQPATRQELLDVIRAHDPFDVGVVVAYGRILRPEVLEIPRRGYLNVHFSLLPRWRGAAPVARALMTGDTMTGITIIELDERLDTGPVLTAQAIDILPGENAGELTSRLSTLGATLLDQVLDSFVDGSLLAVPQSDDGVTYAQKIEKDDRSLTWSEGAANWVNRIRGLSPSPAAVLDIDDVAHKVLGARTHEARIEPGTWEARDDQLVIGTGDGSVEILELQPSGKDAMSGGAWLRGRRADSGVVG